MSRLRSPNVRTCFPGKKPMCFRAGFREDEEAYQERIDPVGLHTTLSCLLLPCPHPLIPGVGPVAPRPKGYGSGPGTIQASLVSPKAGLIFPLIQCITSITSITLLSYIVSYRPPQPLSN